MKFFVICVLLLFISFQIYFLTNVMVKRNETQIQILSTLQTIQIQTGVDYAQDVEKIKTELPERGKE